jgi:hypothetical protein
MRPTGRARAAIARARPISGARSVLLPWLSERPSVLHVWTGVGDRSVDRAARTVENRNDRQRDPSPNSYRRPSICSKSKELV